MEFEDGSQLSVVSRWMIDDVTGFKSQGDQMARSNFENLHVYRLSEEIADAIWDVATVWNQFARDTVGKQIVRAADSIGANIAEGDGRGTYQEHRRFVRIARGSLNETKHWLRRAFKRNLLSPQQIDQLKPLLDELSPRLNAYLRSIGRDQSNKASNSIAAPDQLTTDN